MLRLCSQTSFTSIYGDDCDTRTYDDDDSYDGDGDSDVIFVTSISSSASVKLFTLG